MVPKQTTRLLGEENLDPPKWQRPRCTGSDKLTANAVFVRVATSTVSMQERRTLPAEDTDKTICGEERKTPLKDLPPSLFLTIVKLCSLCVTPRCARAEARPRPRLISRNGRYCPQRLCQFRQRWSCPALSGKECGGGHTALWQEEAGSEKHRHGRDGWDSEHNLQARPRGAWAEAKRSEGGPTVRIRGRARPARARVGTSNFHEHSTLSSDNTFA